MQQVPGVVMPKLNYRQWKERAEKQVVRWQWSTWHTAHPLPFYFELYHGPRGRVLKKAPGQPHEFDVREGFDSQGRVMVARRYTDIFSGGHRWFDEEFFNYNDDRVEWAEFDYSEPEKGLNKFHRLRFSNGLPFEYTCAGKVNSERATYAFSGGKLITIDSVIARPDLPRPVRHVATIQWGAAGVPDTMLVKHGDQPQKVVWRRPALAANMRTLLKRCEDHIVAAIPPVVKALRLKEPAYCVALSFDEENDLLPPTVSVGVQSERENWFRTKAAEAPDYIWNPAEFKHFDVCDLAGNEAAAEDFRMLNQLMDEEETEEQVLTMLLKASRRLAAHDWGKAMPVTDDFVVYSVDLELSMLIPCLRHAAGARKFRAWAGIGIAPKE